MKNIKYKKSIYNILFREDEKNYLYNSLSNSFAELEKKEFDIFNSFENENEISENNINLINKLKKGNFINDTKFNEINYLKSKYNALKMSDNELSLTITPTLACNFRCPYCFEDEKIVDSLSDQELEKLIKFTKDNLEGKKKLDITWYGGEPLLKPDIIDKFSREIIDYCDERGIEYSAFIITNGYYLTEEMLHKMYWWRIRGVQVTIDGPRDIHNKTRILANKKGSYDEIIENIKYACDKVNVLIRVNISNINKDYIGELLDNFKELGLEKYIVFELSIVSAPTEESQKFMDEVISDEEFSKIRLNALRKALDLDFRVNLYPNGFTGCGAVNRHTYVIGGDSHVYKCWNNVGVKEESIGHLDTGNRFNGHEFDWLAFSPFEENDCLNCNILPLCMGKCPYYKVMKGHKSNCVEYKYDLIESLKLHKEYKEKLTIFNSRGEKSV